MSYNLGYWNTFYKMANRFEFFNEICWPVPGERMGEIEHTLRYGEPKRTDLLLAASVLSAYRQLVSSSTRKRNYVIKMIRADKNG